MNSGREFVIQAHKDQLYGSDPYIVHCDAVVRILQEHGYTGDIIVIGYLHDVLEDTDVIYEQLEYLFGSYIATCVQLISDEPGRNRKERKYQTYQKLQSISEEYYNALIVKVADRIANVQACIKTHDTRLSMYKQEQKAFREAIYRNHLCESLWIMLDSLLLRN